MKSRVTEVRGAWVSANAWVRDNAFGGDDEAHLNKLLDDRIAYLAEPDDDEETEMEVHSSWPIPAHPKMDFAKWMRDVAAPIIAAGGDYYIEIGEKTWPRATLASSSGHVTASITAPEDTEGYAQKMDEIRKIINR